MAAVCHKQWELHGERGEVAAVNRGGRAWHSDERQGGGGNGTRMSGRASAVNRGGRAWHSGERQGGGSQSVDI